MMIHHSTLPTFWAKSANVVEYANYISAEGKDALNEWLLGSHRWVEWEYFIIFYYWNHLTTRIIK